MGVTRRELLKYGAASFAVLAVNRVRLPGVFEVPRPSPRCRRST
jgi:hypothetical protein